MSAMRKSIDALLLEDFEDDRMSTMYRVLGGERPHRHPHNFRRSGFAV